MQNKQEELTTSVISYVNIINTADVHLQKIKKPLHFKKLIDHIIKELGINPKTSMCYGNIHYALSSDRRFVSTSTKTKTTWALRDWFSRKDLKPIQNKNIIHDIDFSSDSEDLNNQAGNNAVGTEQNKNEDSEKEKPIIKE